MYCLNGNLDVQVTLQNHAQRAAGRKTKITLINHPTTALHIDGFSDPDLSELEGGIYLGNTYERIMPISLLRVASVLTRHLDVEIDVLDLRLSDRPHRKIYKTVKWEKQYTIEVERVGRPFDDCNDRIEGADWVGLSSHFTFESGIVRDLIHHIKKVKPHIKIMVGGDDVKARPEDYIAFGADLAFVGDFNPAVLANYREGKHVVGPYSHPIEELADPALEKLRRLRDYVGSYDGPVPQGVGYPIGPIYFSRGCPRECDFCESRRSRFGRLSLDSSFAMLEEYRKAGIKSLNFTDENMLLIAATPSGRNELIELFDGMRRMGFAWEFPIGLEIGRFIKGNELDEKLMEAMFDRSFDSATGRLTGAYRVYVPLETFERREQYKKLRSREEQNKVISRLAGAGLPEIDFGVVLPPSATEETFNATRDGYLGIKDIITSRGAIKARYAVFHLIPVALFRGMKTKYSIDEFPEAWNLYFPNYDGQHFNARELFERRLKLIKEIDPPNYGNMRTGQYTYG